jgi:cysteine-rich repeat protein
VRARAYSASDAPLGHEFTIADELAGAVRVSRLADSHFVTVWNPAAPVSAKVVSLCLPSIAQCGDGIPHPECEDCDDGLSNSDTAPDACRSDCSLPRCGDGVVDGAEQCDDGNATNCDGCSVNCVAEPGIACGDGIPEPSCAQPCDDGNATVGDGCTSQCTLEPIPGGGSSLTDCRAVWIVDNPSNAPLLDKHGAFRAKQRCVDDDPSCDFDGGTPGSCTFRVRVCANASGLSGCQLGFRLAAWSLDRPSATQAEAVPALAAVRDAFAGVPGTILGPTIDDLCTDWLPVALPLKGVAGNYREAKLTLKSKATTYDGDADTDQLRLTCVPAS